MAPTPRSITDTELTVLKALWDLGSGTVRSLQETLRQQGHTWAYTTVQTLLLRLQQKGFITSEKDGRAYRFAVSVSREQLISDELEDLAHRLCEGAAAPLILTLVEGNRFSQSEIDRLRRLLDEAEDSRPKRNRRGDRSE